MRVWPQVEFPSFKPIHIWTTLIVLSEEQEHMKLGEGHCGYIQGEVEGRETRSWISNCIHENPQRKKTIPKYFKIEL